MLQVREPETIPPPEKTGLRTTSTVILATAASAAGLFFGRDFFVPIVFALLLNALFRPIVRWLERRRLPTTIGAAIVLLGIITLMTAAGFALAGPLQRWLQDAPQRFNTAGQKLDKLRQPVQQVKEVATQLEHAAQGPATAPAPALNPAPPPPPNTSLAARFVGGTTKFISELVEVLLLLYLLQERGRLEEKPQRAYSCGRARTATRSDAREPASRPSILRRRPTPPV